MDPELIYFNPVNHKKNLVTIAWQKITLKFSSLKYQLFMIYVG